VQTYDIVTTPRVKLSLSLAVSIEQFFGEDLVANIARLLKWVDHQCCAWCRL
jgi:hypothetical protein